MKVRIYRSLLLMGIVSVITTFILSAILYYQGDLTQRESGQAIQGL